MSDKHGLESDVDHSLSEQQLLQCTEHVRLVREFPA